MAPIDEPAALTITPQAIVPIPTVGTPSAKQTGVVKEAAKAAPATPPPKLQYPLNGNLAIYIASIKQ